MFFIPKIFLTSTKLELGLTQRLIWQTFLEKMSWAEVFENSKLQNKELELKKIWQRGLSAGQILLPKLESKTDWALEMAEFYINYPKPSLIFLTDLSDLSLVFQEGMLRFLEEPPKNLQIILFAQNKSQILPTIQSRCHFFSLPKDFIYQNLSAELLLKTKNKLPSPKIVCQNLLAQEPIEIEKITDLEREEIDFWLWQIESYLSEFFKQNTQKNTSFKIAQAIEKVLQAKKFNSQNLQKKLLLDWLNQFLNPIKL